MITWSHMIIDIRLEYFKSYNCAKYSWYIAVCKNFKEILNERCKYKCTIYTVP